MSRFTHVIRKHRTQSPHLFAMTRTSAFTIATLLGVALSAPTSLRNACTPDGERCAGAPGKEYVAWLGCCGGSAVDCIAHPDYESDPDNLWGRYCLPVSGYPSSDGGSSESVTPNTGGYPDASSGGDCSRATITAETIPVSGSCKASKISLEFNVKPRGTPSARLRPRTSISRTSSPG